MRHSQGVIHSILSDMVRKGHVEETLICKPLTTYIALRRSDIDDIEGVLVDSEINFWMASLHYGGVGPSPHHVVTGTNKRHDQIFQSEIRRRSEPKGTLMPSCRIAGTLAINARTHTH